jgi:hypothetical protein
MRPIYPSYSTHIARSFPRIFCAAFVIVFLTWLFGRWLKDQPIAIGTVALSAIALGLIFSGLSVSALGYYFRREENIPRRSSATLRIFLFSFVWSSALSALGLHLLGCATSPSCTSWPDIQSAIAVALIVSSLTSLAVLS